MEGIIHLWLPTSPPPLPTLVCATHNITVAVKKLLIIQQCYMAYKNSYKTYSSYTVNLVWLQCTTRELQWFQYFKLVFLVEITNVPLRTVLTNPVTNTALRSK